MALLLRGIRRTLANQSDPRVRLPITATLMRHIKRSLAEQAQSFQGKLLWAACCTGFFGFLRCGEFLVPDSTPFDPNIHLSVADIVLVTSSDPWIFFLRIKVSKTDQFCQGSTVALGSTGSDLCPVAALLDFLEVRGGGGALDLSSDLRVVSHYGGVFLPARFSRPYLQPD